MTVEARPSGELRLRRPVPATAIAAVGTQQPAANVIEDIGLADIAEAVHVTARAVQYMFRRHLDTTPLRYLREVRLHYAHEDLLIANRRQDTVTAIGRFAVFYRQTYGHSPHTTLRG